MDTDSNYVIYFLMDSPDLVVCCCHCRPRNGRWQLPEYWPLLAEPFLLAFTAGFSVEMEYREMLFQLETEHSDKELYQIIAQSRPVQMISY